MKNQIKVLKKSKLPANVTYGCSYNKEQVVLYTHTQAHACTHIHFIVICKINRT